MTGRVGLEPTTPDSSNQRKIFAVRIYCGLHLLFYEWAQIKETNKCERPMAGTAGFAPATGRLTGDCSAGLSYIPK